MLTFNNITADSFAADTQQGAGRRRPRHREALSCSQCRERKVRCDRKQPCKQCHGRGQSNICSYASSKDASMGHNHANNLQTLQGQQQPQPNSHQPQQQAQPNGHGQQQRKVQTEPSSPLSSGSNESDMRKRLDRLEQLFAATSGNGGSGRVNVNHNEDAKGRDLPQVVPGNGSLPVRNALQYSRGPLLSAKTRFIGGTHWLAACNSMTVLKAMLNKSAEFRSSHRSFAEIKAWTRSANSVAMSYPLSCADAASLFSLLPPRSICEGWIRTYLQTYRHIYDIVDDATLEETIEKVWGPAGSNDDPTVVCIVILLVSIGMQCDKSERLTGRRLARYVEQFAFTSGHLQKPCIGSMEVLLLLTLLKTIACSDTESLDSLSAIMGLTSQVALAMGLHRNPSTFGCITNYHSEVRRRLWSIFFRLNFEHCMRTGVPSAIQPEDTDVGYPANVNLTEVPSDYELGMESKDLSVHTDATFSILASRLVCIAAPYQRAVCIAGSSISFESMQQLRNAYDNLLGEAPQYNHPRAKVAGTAEELQQSFLTIAMNSTLLVLSLHFVINVSPDAVEKQHLHAVRDHSLKILESFQTLSQKSRQVQTLAYQLLWSDACRAAFSAGMALNRLRELESRSIMAIRLQHTLVHFQGMLLKHLTFMANFWFQSAHLGPTASKNCLLLAVVRAVTERLFSEENDVSEQELLDVGARSVEATVDLMKNAMQRRHSFPISPQPSISSTSHSTRMIGESGRSVSSPNMADSWPTTGGSSMMAQSQPSTGTMMGAYATSLGNGFGHPFVTPDPSSVGWTPQEMPWPMDGFEYAGNSASMSPVSHVPSRQATVPTYVEGLISPPIADWSAGTSQWVEDVGMSF